MEPRTFRKLRISLTDECNLACTYCVSESQALNVQKARKPLRVEQIISIVEAIHNSNPLEKIRLTGGEPLIYPDVVPLVKGLKNLGIADIGMTTNGYYLKHLAGKLKRAGLQSVNVSLDALSPEVFKQMTRKPLLQKTLDGILAAQRYGLEIKINSVVLKGMNEQEIVPLLKFGIENDIPVRFLELMKMGYLHHNFKQYFFSQQEMLNRIAKDFEIRKTIREKSSTARYWEVENKNYKFGIIANESEPFCVDCDRLRLDSHGQVFGCISAVKGINAMSLIENNADTEALLEQAMLQKQSLRFVGSEISMRHLGG